ncbi:MAG: TonB-dependent receptor, partial [Candidatus Binataceae bacterium]
MNGAKFWLNQHPCGYDAAVVRSHRDPPPANRRIGWFAAPGWRLLALAGSLVIGLASPGLAAARPISGTVTDALSRPLAQVRIELREASDRVVAHAGTDKGGRFKIAPPRPGTYLLVAAKPGFKPAQEAVAFPRGAATAMPITLAAETAVTLPVQVRAIRAQNGVSTTGANKYTVTAQDISNLPRGSNTAMTDVLAQMPGVAIDQNQQIHIRNTEGPQFQYQINGVMVPLDINTNPPFISMINPMFVKRLSLLDGILPSRYSYATGGIVNIQTKDGCEQPGGSTSMYGGQRNTVQPSFQYGSCNGDFSYYVSGLYSQSNTAFSSATPAPDAIHDYTNQGQAFGFFAYELNPTTRLSLIASVAASNNQLPNQANLAPQYQLTGAGYYPSANIDSYLDFRDYLGILALNGSLAPNLSYQLAYAAHYISQKFEPDDTGELLYQGIASTAFHSDLDNTLEGDLTWQLGAHTLGAGFYLGEYAVEADDNSLVFKVDSAGNQTGPPYTPVRAINNANKINLLSGIYLEDTWQLTEKFHANFGVRWDRLSGFTYNNQIDPNINLVYLPWTGATLHGG